MPDVEGDKPLRQRFKRYPILARQAIYHIAESRASFIEVQTGEGKLYLFVTIDRTSKYAVTLLVEG